MTRSSFEVWFDFASTYSYLTMMRAEPLLREAGLDPAWRPFLLGPVFRSRGMETSPFVLNPVKGAYMWRDVERRAESYGLSFKRPGIFPMNSLRAARIMTAALGTPWAGDFARGVFEANFARGEDIEEDNILAGALEEAGAEPGHWMARAQHDAVKRELRARTEEAMRHGIFGAPSFRVSGELFWGDDRLEEALSWALGRHPASMPVNGRPERE